MENASKALIIAGAILLSILIISLGLVVYNQAKETIGSINLTQQQIQAFNSKFTSYEGPSISGVKVNELIQTVISSNQQAIDDNTGAYIAIRFPAGKKASDTSDKWRVLYGVSQSDVKVHAMASKSDDFYDTVAKISGAFVSGKSLIQTSTLGNSDSNMDGLSLRVPTGYTYKVDYGYTNGAISTICVTGPSSIDD